MADTTMGDTDVLYLGLLALALIALIPGLVIHSFIIGVNVSDWWRGRSVTPVDHIVTSFAIIRICAQFSVVLYLMVVTFFMRMPASYLSLVIIGRIYSSFIYANIGFTSLHSIVLCLKISNLHTRLFLYLRRMILHRTGYLIVALGIFSTFNSLVSFLLAFMKIINGGDYNTTTDTLSLNCIHTNSIYIFTVGTFIPLLFYCISSVLLFVSLYHHTARMKMSSNLSINLETYYSMMKLLSFTFIYNTVYFSGNFVCTFYYSIYCVNILWIYVVLGFLPPLHSSYLIYRMAKLRNQMFKVLQNVMGFLFQKKGNKTRENIEVVDQ